MLDVSPQKLREEVEQSAIPFMKLHTAMSDRIVRRYAGPSYRSDWKGSESGDNKEAHDFEYTVNAVPNLIHNNPKVESTNLLPGIDDQFKQILDAVMPAWIDSVEFADKLEPVAYDMQSGFGVVMVGVEPLPGYENADGAKPLRPGLFRVSNRRFFVDPQTPDGDIMQARYMGHSWTRDQEDLLNDPLFDKEAVGEMGVDTDLDKSQTSVNKPTGNMVQRKQVVGYEIWVRETNTVYTLGATKGDKFLRPPRPFGGCKYLGPYTLFGVYAVPDQLIPLPILAVTSGMVDELNAHRGQAADSAAAAKTLIFVDSQNKQAKVAVVSGSNGTVHTVPGLGPGGVQRVDVMGPSKDNMAYIQHLQDHLDRTSGLNQTQRGELTGSTAEEAALASQSTNARTVYAQKQFRKSVVKVLKQAANFIIFNEQVVMLVSVPDPATGQKVPMVYKGGMNPGEDPTAYDRLHFKIEPNSMELTDQGVRQRQMASVATLAEATVPLMPTSPWFKWREMFNDIGATMNIENMGDRYIDGGTLMGAQQAMVMQQQMAVAGEQQGMVQGDQQAQQGQEAHNKAMKEPPGSAGSKGPPKQRKKPAGAKA